MSTSGGKTSTSRCDAIDRLGEVDGSRQAGKVTAETPL
jgi:hypothetical protein